jgi:osmotically-inducible protein OsmY
MRPIIGIGVPPASFTPGSRPAYSAAISARLNRIARNAGMNTESGIVVYMRGNTAVLTGTVRTEHDRDVLANLASLEPGVEAIENRLGVTVRRD